MELMVANARLKYTVEVIWSDEDESYVADVPELPYCMAHGETYEEAMREIVESMTLHVEVLKKLGRPVPEPRLAS